MLDIDEELQDELVELDEQSTGSATIVDDDFNEEEYIFSDKPVTRSDDPNKQLIEQLLKSRGISDSKITLLEEDNTEKEVDFFDLSQEEQLEVIGSLGTGSVENTDNVDIADEQKQFLQYLKDNNLSVAEYLTKYREATINELEGQYAQAYDIDAYEDDELFLLDLKAKYDLTDEELEKELTKAKEDQDLYNKKVKKLREEYKELEDAYKEEERSRFETDRSEKYDQMVQTMVDVAVANPELHGIELEDDEKNEVLSYLLELDENGTSQFYRELNDPLRLYEAAWFLRYGKDAFNTLVDAYEQEIKKLKGDTRDDKKVIIRKDQPQKSIYDLN